MCAGNRPKITKKDLDAAKQFAEVGINCVYDLLDQKINEYSRDQKKENNMKALLIISLILACLGFLALAAIPAKYLSLGITIAAISSASIGCIGLVVYGIGSNN